MEILEIEKSIWTHDDFEEMGWHDANIYGMVIENNDNPSADFLLDIDYIFKWVNPVPPAQNYTFWIAPCTLIFKECFDLNIECDTGGGYLELFEIEDLCLNEKTEQEKNRFVYKWTIELQQGVIELKSYGLEQVVRQKPAHVKNQVLSLGERGGINFGRKSYK